MLVLLSIHAIPIRNYEDWGGATERSKLKKYIKNQKSKQRCQYNKDLKKIYERCKPTIEQQPIVVEQDSDNPDAASKKAAEIKKAKKIYKSMMPQTRSRYGKSIADMMTESATMAKYIADDAVKKAKCRIFSGGLTKALNQLLSTDWKSEWVPGDEPTLSVQSSDCNLSDAKMINFSGAVKNLRNQNIPSPKCMQKSLRNDNKTKDESVEIDISSKALPDADLKFDSNGSPIFKSPKSDILNFESPKFEFSQDDPKMAETAHYFQSMQIHENPELSDIFDSINLMIGNKLGVHSRTFQETNVVSATIRKRTK